MQQRNINIDFRVLFGDIFIVPFLGPALRQLTAKCAARGGEIWLQKKKKTKTNKQSSFE